ncbi:hypothetical protein KVP10_13085 [Candidimonas humi]|uniref:MaoC/PaaZ C-terminal domain-containing protein n=1 Tax=Candidimonas humi TaxID=683355 RepID=A0ABV8NXM2_9BURK|nr:MaoC/PaaZ C-terminal domain-containing protein [Candidimonas humi]MBV6305826.1 hypothetical protein [Candidimonas humi]
MQDHDRIELAMKPGSRHEIRRGPISTTQLVKYAGASGDFNRIHFDHPFAMQAGLGGVVVHGMLTMGFAASCVNEHVRELADVDEISARFLAPLKAGDVVDLSSTVVQVDGRTLHMELLAVSDGRTVMSGKARAVLRSGA